LFRGCGAAPHGSRQRLEHRPGRALGSPAHRPPIGRYTSGVARLPVHLRLPPRLRGGSGGSRGGPGGSRGAPGGSLSIP
jgi:hypothetical protein